jgi:Fur family zinc uptake transcriptional regulator
VEPLISPSAEQARRAAHERCAAAGGQLTSMRARVLDAVIDAAGPIRAYELMEAFARAGRPAKPPSVYRALDFWTGLGVMHRVESLNAYAVCGAAHHPGDVICFFLCEGCGAAEEWPVAGLDAPIKATADASGFRIRASALEVKGLCTACAAAQSGVDATD